MSVTFVTSGHMLTAEIFVCYHNTIIKTIIYATLLSNNF